MAVCGLKIVGTKYLPPILPTLLTEKVLSSKSLFTSLLFSDLNYKSFKSWLIYLIVFKFMFLILGVVKPSLESIAIEKLWSFLIIYSFISPSESTSGFTIEFTMGNSSIANDNAFIKNGSNVRPSMWHFASFLS